MAVKELKKLLIDEVALVDRAANKRVFICMKRDVLKAEHDATSTLAALIVGAMEGKQIFSIEQLASMLPITVDDLIILMVGGSVSLSDELVTALSSVLGLSVDAIKPIAVAAVEEMAEQAAEVVADAPEVIADIQGAGEPAEEVVVLDGLENLESEAGDEITAEQFTAEREDAIEAETEQEEEEVKKSMHDITDDEKDKLKDAAIIMARLVSESEREPEEEAEPEDDNDEEAEEVAKHAVDIFEMANAILNKKDVTNKELEAAQKALKDLDSILEFK